MTFFRRDESIYTSSGSITPGGGGGGGSGAAHDPDVIVNLRRYPPHQQLPGSQQQRFDHPGDQQQKLNRLHQLQQQPSNAQTFSGKVNEYAIRMPIRLRSRPSATR